MLEPRSSGSVVNWTSAWYDRVPRDFVDMVRFRIFLSSVVLHNELRYALSFTVVSLLLTTTDVSSFL